MSKYIGIMLLMSECILLKERIKTLKLMSFFSEIARLFMASPWRLLN